MKESPRKRILTEISKQQNPSSLKINSNIQPSGKFQRLQQIFKFSPTHSQEISIQEKAYNKTGRSKYKLNIDCIQQLNSILKLRKVDTQKPFFSEKTIKEELGVRSKSKINRDIQHSIVYIQNIKKKHVFHQKSHQNRASSPVRIRQDKKQTLFQTIGLELPIIKQKNYQHNSRFITEPQVYQKKKIKKKKNPQQKGLYSYLERDFLQKKEHDLTQTKLINYAKNPNNHNFHRIILEKSRKFLKHTAKNGYRQLQNIDNMIHEQSKKIIEQEIKNKKQQYERDYRTRNNIPYFSFLTLNQKQKKSVLKGMHRKRSIS